MFIQDNLEHIEAVSGANFPNPKFLLMVMGMVAGFIVLFALAGSTPGTFRQTGLVWALLAILSLLPFSAGSRLMKLRTESSVGISPSIRTNFS